MLRAFVLACMLLLAPNRDHSLLATAIAARVEVERPLFKDDAAKLKTASLVVAIAFRESSFTLDAVGDSGHSFCAMQVSDGSGGSPALLHDADACVLAAWRILQWSFRICPANPVAPYASGTNGCDNARALRISRDRLSIAARLVRDVGAGDVVARSP